jgi:hypothetical protein
MVCTGLLLLSAACARRGPRTAAASGVTPRRTLPADSVFILGAGGTPPADTVARVPAGRAHAVVLRHPPPDLATFAVVEFGDGAFEGGDSVDVTFKVHPGTYGLDIASARPFTGGTITFKYARYFVAPEAARQRYGTDARFETQLAVGRPAGNGTIVLLPTSRVASDNVSAPLEGAGSYVVAGPK